MLSLYIHIPFCKKKCPYCHFYVIPNRPSHQKILQEALLLELDSIFPLIQNREIVSIYFGGGTPSLFEGIALLLEKIPKTSPCEITIEANPEDLSIEKLIFFLSIGINRLSLGVQSLDQSSLETLGREHSAEKALFAIHAANRAGFQNISIDLMYDLPQQTVKSLDATLAHLEFLPIQHVSLYNLTIEPHTPFYKRKVSTPNPKHSLRLLNNCLKSLKKMGLVRYEISAFALPGFESKHNLGYWTGREFLGLGPSAFSFYNGKRFRNIANFNRYVKCVKNHLSPVDFSEELPHPQNVHERLAIKLRLKEGVNLDEFKIPNSTLSILEKLKQQGLLKQIGKQIQLTKQGTLFYDTIAAEII